MLRLVVLVALVAVTSCGNDKTELKDTNNCDACGGDCLLETFEIGNRQHTLSDVAYETLPPSGGQHDPCWVPWGIYDHAVRTERWVHNLEHGGLVFLYDCPEGCDDDVAALTAFVESLPPGRAVMAPYAEMDSRVAVVSWGVRMTSDCVDTAALRSFYDANVGHAPENLTQDPVGCPAP
ncbi:MAG: DUF3105 domain-containing protein [Myxococcota bacterium]